MKTKFPWSDFLKRLAIIAIPVALQNLLTTTASMVDTIMVAPLGELSVGALGLCSQFASLQFSAYWGFVGGGMLFFAQFWGSKEKDKLERAYGLFILCLMAIALIFSVAALFFPEKIMQVYTDKASIQEIGIQYLRIVGVAYFFQVFSVGVSSFLRSIEQVRIPFVASIVSVATNIFLNWVFIYGHLGAPAMGIRGAAFATTIAAIVNTTVMLVVAAIKGYHYIFHIKGMFSFKKAFTKEFFKKCFPVICNEVMMGVGNMVINIVLGRQPEHVIAALAVFRTLEGLVIGFFAGFSNASSILVGTCVGAGELKTAYERAKRLVYLCSAFIFLICLALIGLHTPILHAMSLQGDSFKAGTVFVCIYAVISIIRMGNWIQNDTYRAAGDAVYGTVLEIVFMYVFLLPCVLLAGFYFHAPYWMIFICCYLDEPIRYVLMQIHLYKGTWIKPVTDAGKAALPHFFEELHAKKRVNA